MFRFKYVCFRVYMNMGVSVPSFNIVLSSMWILSLVTCYFYIKELKYDAIHNETGELNGKAVPMIRRQLESLHNWRYSIEFVMIDIDHLKVINDNFGHSEGNIVIEFLISYILNNKDENDHFIRVGGDEFLLVLVSQSVKSLDMKANLLGDVLKSCTRFQKRPFSVSIGRSQYFGLWTDALETADQALYGAKHSGGNTIVSFNHTESNKIIPLQSTHEAAVL